VSRALSCWNTKNSVPETCRMSGNSICFNKKNVFPMQLTSQQQTGKKTISSDTFKIGLCAIFAIGQPCAKIFSKVWCATFFWDTVYIQGGQKKLSHILLSISSKILTVFQTFFTCTFCGKFVINWLLRIPPHLNYVATLPCEI